MSWIKTAKNRPKLTYIKNMFEMEEFIKCRQNPGYFINTYVKIPHAQRGEIPFKMYGFQKSLLLVYLMYQYSICLKPRQMGISTLVAAYALWLALFHTHKYILICSITQGTARSLLRRIKYMYDRLPSFLQVEITADSADRLAFANSSDIGVSGSTENAGRSDSLSCLIMDEAAFQMWGSTTWGSAQPTLSTGGQAIILSTAFGVGNFFYNEYQKAVQNQNGMFPVRLKWQMHPERNEKWYLEQLLRLGKKRVAQEVDCNFLQSGYNVFDMAKIRAIEERLNQMEPKETGFDGKYIKYFDPEPGEHYYIGGDVASGRARDYSAFSVYNNAGREHACFKGKIGIREFAYLLGDTGREFNHALLAPECNSIGEGVIATLQENGYSNIFTSVRKTLRMEEMEHEESSVYGWLTTGKSRHEIITGMDDDLTQELVEVNNPFFCTEAYTFIYNSANRPVAAGKTSGSKKQDMYDGEESGDALVYTDDSIIGSCIGNEVRKAPHRFRGALPFIAGGN